jgi:hypothetical protein
VKSSKDLKWYHHLQASLTNIPLIGALSTNAPSHGCVKQWQVPSQDHMQPTLVGKVDFKEIMKQQSLLQKVLLFKYTK